MFLESDCQPNYKPHMAGKQQQKQQTNKQRIEDEKYSLLFIL